jgi:hypothetical protein
MFQCPSLPLHIPYLSFIMDRCPLPSIATGSSGPSATDGVHQCFSISKQDANILHQHLDDFQKADKDTHADIIQRAMVQIYQFHLSNASFDKMGVGQD